MSKNEQARKSVPLWMKIVIIIAMLPVVAYPAMLTNTPEDNPAKLLTWFYPMYVAVSGICAWICYGRRTEVSWILIVLMLLTHIAMWLLVSEPLMTQI